MDAMQRNKCNKNDHQPRSKTNHALSSERKKKWLRITCGNQCISSARWIFEFCHSLCEGSDLLLIYEYSYIQSHTTPFLFGEFYSTIRDCNAVLTRKHVRQSYFNSGRVCLNISMFSPIILYFNYRQPHGINCVLYSSCQMLFNVYERRCTVSEPKKNNNKKTFVQIILTSKKELFWFQLVF